jgi:hydroxyacylglutathione hydrolase
MNKIEITQIPYLNDNYAYLLHEASSAITAVIDPGEAWPVIKAAKERGWTITHVLATHHHGDHVGGLEELAAEFPGLEIFAGKGDAERIPGVTRVLMDNEEFAIGKAKAKALAIPGHTIGHLVYYFPEANALFSGDALFLLGCGRLFEGNAAEMWQGLESLRTLPGQTLIYCAHEYTAANARFALAIDPSNSHLATRVEAITTLRAAGKPTVPEMLGVELKTNPFLRPDAPELQKALGLVGHEPAEVFAEIRHRKDVFK